MPELEKKNGFLRVYSPFYSSKPIAEKPQQNITKLAKINPWFVTGLGDGEGCFTIKILRSNQYKTGWSVTLSFQVILHIKDINLLENLKRFLGVENIYIIQKNNSCMYTVNFQKDINIILEHFHNYPLITQKQADF